MGLVFVVSLGIAKAIVRPAVVSRRGIFTQLDNVTPLTVGFPTQIKLIFIFEVFGFFCVFQVFGVLWFFFGFFGVFFWFFGVLVVSEFFLVFLGFGFLCEFFEVFLRFLRFCGVFGVLWGFWFFEDSVTDGQTYFILIKNFEILKYIF